MPAISVILTSYNHEKYIREAIDSVLAQSFADFELIIWDDASTDMSANIINNYNDSRIIFYSNSRNKGPAYGINKAIVEIAQGEFIAIHHSDDVWEENKLEKQINFLIDNQQYGAVFSDATAIGEDSGVITNDEHFYTKIFNQPVRTSHEWLNYFFYEQNALCHPSILIRKSCYENCGTYKNTLVQLPDLDMWIRLCMQYQIYIIPEKLVRFRVRAEEANTSGNRLETRSRNSFEFFTILKNYKNIKKFDDLVKVFPQAEKFNCGSESDLSFALAQIFLNVDNSPLHWLLGLEMLFDALNTPEKAKRYKELYNFDYMNFTKLSGNFGIVNRSLADYEHELASIYGSRSWKLTTPLREIGGIFAKLKKLLLE